jgi:hypothetical protein
LVICDSTNAAVSILTTPRACWAECLIVQNLAFGKERTNSYFKLLLREPESPERFIVVIRSESAGRFQVRTAGWRSSDTWLISLSECSATQECMLLMSAESWIKTELGRFALTPNRDRPWLARLILTSPVPE